MNSQKYKKFKEKTVDKKAISEIADLVDELYLLQFYEECIFWGNKFVEDSRVRDSGERLNAFSILFTSYFQTNNFEKAIECGQIVYQYQMNDFKGKELCRSIYRDLHAKAYTCSCTVKMLLQRSFTSLCNKLDKRKDEMVLKVLLQINSNLDEET